MERSIQSEPGLAPVRSTPPVRVAIVEDQAGVAASLTKLINRVAGLQVIAAYPDGETALAQIPRQKPEVVLMDIGLPGMSGIDCVRELKAVLPALPIIMLTVYDDGEHLFNSLKAGASGYLQQMGAATSEMTALTRREHETLALLAEGYRYKEIADRLGISIETVREYVRNTYRKLHVSSRTEAVVKYLNK